MKSQRSIFFKYSMFLGARELITDLRILNQIPEILSSSLIYRSTHSHMQGIIYFSNAPPLWLLTSSCSPCAVSLRVFPDLPSITRFGKSWAHVWNPSHLRYGRPLVPAHRFPKLTRSAPLVMEFILSKTFSGNTISNPKEHPSSAGFPMLVCLDVAGGSQVQSPSGHTLAELPISIRRSLQHQLRRTKVSPQRHKIQN